MKPEPHISQLSEAENKSPFTKLLIHTHLFAGSIFLSIAALVLLLKQFDFYHGLFYMIAPNGKYYYNESFIAVSLLLAPILLLFLRTIALYKNNKIWLTCAIIIFILISGFYISGISIIVQNELFVTPLLSTAIELIVCGLIGYVFENIFFVRYVGLIRFITGILAMMVFHHYLEPHYACWFIAIPIFWIYDFISTDNHKLIRIQKMENPRLDYTQQLLISVICIIYVIAPSFDPKLPEFAITRNWIGPNE
jgi:hypothetical protein